MIKSKNYDGAVLYIDAEIYTASSISQADTEGCTTTTNNIGHTVFC